MRNYVIVCFLSKNPPHEFPNSEWPMHVTILRPFTSEHSPDDFVRVLVPICARTQILTLAAKSEELFGPNRDVEVTELTLTEELKLFQNQILEACAPWTTFKGPSFPEFRPHVTAQKEGRITIGNTVVLDSLSLVEQGQPYRVIRTLNLYE
jgi:2'-5' RNA ligase